MLFTIAHLPEPCVGTLPIFTDPVQPTANPDPRIVGDGAHVLVVQVKRIHKLAVDVKLELRHGCVADACRTGPTIALPFVHTLLRDLAVSVNGEEHRNRLIRAEVLGCAALNPIHESCSLFPKANAEERVDCKSRVPYPGVAVIPVPCAPDDFWQAACWSGNDRPGRFEGEKLQSQSGSLHLLSPAPLVGTGRKPLLPELQGSLEKLFGFQFGRRERNRGTGVVSPQNEDLRLPFLKDELRVHTALPVLLQGHRGRKSKGQFAGIEACSIGVEESFVALTSVVEGGAAMEQESHRPLDTVDAATEMVIPR